jgi:hypothetical protein
MICAADGGVIDDLIVYRLTESQSLVVANAANAATVAAELTERVSGRAASMTDQTSDYALIAIQGPASAGILGPRTSADLDVVRYYASYSATVAGAKALLARTGYTGEDGFEIFVVRRRRQSGRRWPRDATLGWYRRDRCSGPLRLEADAAVRQRAWPRHDPVRCWPRPGRQADSPATSWQAVLAKRPRRRPPEFVGLMSRTRRFPTATGAMGWRAGRDSGAPSPTRASRSRWPTSRRRLRDGAIRRRRAPRDRHPRQRRASGLGPFLSQAAARRPFTPAPEKFLA